MSSPATVHAECYDAIVRAVPIKQIPSDYNKYKEEGYFLLRWPWLLELQAERVLSGRVPQGRIRVLSVQHTYMRERTFILHLRQNTIGIYNIVFSSGDIKLKKFLRSAGLADPYISPGEGESLDQFWDRMTEEDRLRNAGF
jgi:hypothetical protein